MSFYENTLISKQDLPKTEINKIKEKYTDLINSNHGKVIKIEEWGLLNLARRIKKYNKGFYIHFKFEGSKNTLNEINKKIRIDGSIIRYTINKRIRITIKSFNFGFCILKPVVNTYNIVPMKMIIFAITIY